jgi:hypothetical protein
VLGAIEKFYENSRRNSQFSISCSQGSTIPAVYFGNPLLFWKSAYILEIRLQFEQAPMFYACANILGKRQYFNDFCNEFLLDFVAANICIYFQYLFMHFYVRQFFWRNCFET